MVANVESTDVLTWDKLVELEPKLAYLLAEAQEWQDTGDTKYFCANEIFYRTPSLQLSLKSRITRLVGWLRKDDPILGSSRAYDIAYETIYDVLPNCRNCWCM